MAQDDVYSDHYLVVSASSSVDVQPSSGVEVVINSIAWDGPAGDFTLLGNDGSSQTTALSVGVPGGRTGNTSALGERGFWLVKILITNTNFIRLASGSGSDEHIAYDGFQTK